MRQFFRAQKILRLFPIVAGLMFVYALYAVASVPGRSVRDPVAAPPLAKFAQQVVGQGLIEANSENIAIGVPFGGVVRSVAVNVGDSVKKGKALFTLDNRPAVAAVEQARAQLAVAKANRDDAEFRRKVYEDLVGSTANRKEELGSRRYAAQAAQANVDLAEANLNSSEAVLAQHTINAPVDGVVLRRNVREGEFAQAGVLASPLMVVGNISPLHVRVQIDETQAQQVREGAAAVGTVRGAPDRAIKLKFVRKEPLVIPKRFLSGDAGERADTRILEVIYALEGAHDAAFVGQQMDVFIER